MESLIHYLADPTPCGYLPDQLWQLEYVHVASMSSEEYMKLLLRGWRRFGRVLFRPRCRACTACQSLRVLTKEFRPNRSQRRVRRTNEGAVALEIGEPKVTRVKLNLYDRYHAYQAASKGWPEHPAKDADEYASSFVDHPFPVEEWCYTIGGKLIGVGYVDVLPQGLSAIYFFYDPEERKRSLGIWNVLRVIEEGVRRGLPHAYLGYYIAGCRSMTYKICFGPNQILGRDGQWQNLQDAGKD
jgi:arginine-tRNA-protein transferase